MPRVIKPTAEQWSVLRDLGLTDHQGGCVIVHPDIVAEYEADHGEMVDWSNYDFGGEADVLVDVVSSMNHYFIDQEIETYRDLVEEDV